MCWAGAHDVTKNHKSEEWEPTKKISRNPEEAQLGITLLFPIIDNGKEGFWVRLDRCGLQMWQGSPSIETLGNIRPDNRHSFIRLDPKNVKGYSRFRFKSTIKDHIISKDFLTNLVFKISMLSLRQRNTSLTNFSWCARIVCQFASRGILTNMSCNNVSWPGKAFNVVETKL